MKRSRPSTTFLSCPISASSAVRLRQIAREYRPDRAFIPIAARCARTRLGASCAQRPSRGRQFEGQRAADRHALAMQQPVGIAGRRLERVAEGVAEVEKRPLALLGLVAADDAGLHLDRPASPHAGAGPRSPRRPCAGRSPPASRRTRASPSKPVFHHLAIAGQEIARAAACRARRYRPAPAPAGGRRRQGSCPARVLIPVLPPTELSTCASSVVGTCTKRTPRRRMAAAKPTRSPITPPPSATTRSRRSTFCSSSHSTQRGKLRPALRRLARRQGQRRMTRSPRHPAPRVKRARCSAATVSSVTIATRRRRRSGAISAPARSIRPSPMRTS